MTGRDPTEPHRAATPLELLFDLCFVVAVAQVADALHHDLAEGQIGRGVLSFLAIFFGIWWPWVNFTWFASAFDTDDVLYRLLTFVQIAGVLVVTAGVPSAFESLDFTVTVIGYVIMRIALVGQCLRVAIEDPDARPAALRFAVGIALVQAAWTVRLAIGPPWGYVAIIVLGLLELAVPVWAERAGRPTPWHPGHVAERYGLFTIIVLGECVLAATTAIQGGLAAGGRLPALLAVAAGGLLLVFGLWWSYFKRPVIVGRSQPMWVAFAFSYGHYAIFAAVAALGAGLQVAADSTHGATSLDAPVAAATVAVPAAIYLLAMGILHAERRTLAGLAPVLITAPILLAIAVSATWLGVSVAVLAMGMLGVGLVAAYVVAGQRGLARASG